MKVKSNFAKYIFIIFIIGIIILVAYKLNEEKKNTTDEEQTNVVKEDDIGKEIKLGIAEFDTMNPLLSKNKQVQEITKIIYEPLFQLASDYKLEKCLAKDWAKTAENKYLIKIDTSIKWSDGNNLSVEFRGKVFRNSEHAYQTWKSGTFDEVAYNSTAFKPVGRLSANKAINFNLMVEIITAKLQQHLDLITEIQQRGGLSYIAASTHNVTGDMFWETSGQNKFIEALYQAAKNVGITSINNSDEDLTDDSNCNQPF